MIEVKHGQLCPNSNIMAIASPNCQKCDNYIKHEFISDSHGRIESLLIDCKILNNNEKTNRI